MSTSLPSTTTGRYYGLKSVVILDENKLDAETSRLKRAASGAPAAAKILFITVPIFLVLTVLAFTCLEYECPSKSSDVSTCPGFCSGGGKIATIVFAVLAGLGSCGLCVVWKTS